MDVLKSIPAADVKVRLPFRRHDDDPCDGASRSTISRGWQGTGASQRTGPWAINPNVPALPRQRRSIAAARKVVRSALERSALRTERFEEGVTVGAVRRFDLSGSPAFESRSGRPYCPVHISLTRDYALMGSRSASYGELAGWPWPVPRGPYAPHGLD